MRVVVCDNNVPFNSFALNWLRLSLQAEKVFSNLIVRLNDRYERASQSSEMCHFLVSAQQVHGPTPSCAHWIRAPFLQVLSQYCLYYSLFSSVVSSPSLCPVVPKRHTQGESCVHQASNEQKTSNQAQLAAFLNYQLMSLIAGRCVVLTLLTLKSTTAKCCW